MDEKQRELLVQLRSELVGKMKVQPFTIYDDATIEALVQAKPKTLKELTSVKGFPATGKRVKGFGETIIKIFQDTDNIQTVKAFAGIDKQMTVSTVKKITAF